MYNGNKIKELLALHGQSNKELLNYLGVEMNSSLTQLINGNPSAKKLEKIADFFGVPIDVFFTRDKEYDESKGSMQDAKNLKEKIKLLEQLVEDKNKLIQLLEERNKYLPRDIIGTDK